MSTTSFDDHFAAMPIVAILRGLQPREAVAVGHALVEAGVRIIEVPLNSPEPMTSIGLLADALGDRAAVGAGTVLQPDDVDRVNAGQGHGHRVPELQS